MRMAVAACWVATCSACLLHGGRAAVRPRAAPRLATASADLELEMAWCARIVREAADMLAEACVDTYLEPPCSTYGLCVPASCVLSGPSRVADRVRVSIGDHRVELLATGMEVAGLTRVRVPVPGQGSVQGAVIGSEP